MVAGDRIEKILTPRPHTLTISGWPTTFNALTWSADASIAIALDDCVELLIPKIDVKHLTSDPSILGPLAVTTAATTTAQQTPSLSQTHTSLELEHWFRLRLQTNTFTVAEWSYLEPQLFEEFDIGEEQGLAGVAALEWSNAGLGRFGRCALGVLTANGVLSVWADGGRVKEEGERGWRRRAVVWGVLWKEFRREMGMDVDENGGGDGDAMDVDVEVANNGATTTSHETRAENGDEAMVTNEGFSTTHANGSTTTQNGRTQADDEKNDKKARTSAEQHARAKKSSILHKRCRIRSFCWTQVPRDISNLPSGLKNQAIQECTNHLLIATNDYEEIIVLHVRSPYDNPLSPSDWDVKIVSIIDTKTASEEDWTGPQLFSLQRGLHSISINEWTTEQGKEELWTAFIAYGKNCGLEVMRCTLSYVKDEIVLKTDRDRLLNIPEYDVVGPMCWAPELNAKEMDELFVPLRGSAVNLAFHHARSPTKYELGCTQARDNWSSIAGAAITLDKEPHFHKLHYTPHMPSAGSIKAKSDSWSISSIQDHTSEAVWLKALCQHGDEFSDAYELFKHVEYRVWGMANAPDQRHVAMCYSLHPSDLNQYVTHAQQVSFVSFSDEMKGEVPQFRIENTLESNMYTLSNWLRGQEELDTQPQSRLLQLGDSLSNLGTNTVLSPQIAEAMSLISKAEDLQSLILAIRSGMIRPERLYSRLAKGLESITSGNRFGQIQGYSQDDEQKTIMLELISSILRKVTKTTPLGLAILVMWERAATPPGSDYMTLQSDGANALQEICELCDALVDFESTEEARCRNGHQFTRCALTLLTIQEPGVSKFCAVCNAQYYQEHVLLARERQTFDSEAEARTDEDMALHSVSLTQLLFLAVDRCLFCGGKFTI